MFGDAIKDFAKIMAKWIIPSSVSAGYTISKFPLEMSINSDKDTYDQMVEANRQATEENLQGNAGNAALNAIDQIKTNSDFLKGVNSIR